MSKFMPKPLAASPRKSLQALDYVNVFLADVRDGVGPYLAIYLLATHHWNPASIGVAMSASGIAGLVAQTPSGLINAAFLMLAAIAGVALVVFQLLGNSPRRDRYPLPIVL